MDLDTITVHPDTSVGVILRYLRRRGNIPEFTDNLFVTDREDKLIGVLPLTVLLTSDPAALVNDVIEPEVDSIPVTMAAKDVASLFERRDLITAPVIDEHNRLVGRITIDDIVDVIREEADHSMMSMAGSSVS